ncbi:MAG: glycosyltransferase family 2 protein [Rhodanobacter sp.]|jgi:GT2 family glycosyltransferase|nr:glycosyltransferase family 2 protein [Rhodanobacter sp.]
MSFDVAVAIVTYKSAELTIDCLHSIEVERAATTLGIRVIVVDNASGDAPAVQRAIDEFGWSSWVTLLAAPRNGGFAYGNNLAIREARRSGPPRYFHLLNPDTVLRPGAVRELVSFLDSRAEAGITGSSFENLDGSDWPIAFRFPTAWSELEGALELGMATRLLNRWVVARHMSKTAQPIDWVPGASMMVRWSVIDAIDGLDENFFLYFEETDFCFRAKQKGFATWYVPASRVMHIAGQSTKVTERNAAPKRLPAYWFESRRRFFVVTYGIPYAIFADLLALAGNCFGVLKRMLQRRRGVPNYARDLLAHSVIWRKNRTLFDAKSSRNAG